ncbi:30S ribosomal protein S4e [Candidatus Woesearchaeota archaeon]|nr:30S ribosomal protein S4e [Candidatus Woesearchaeota archaeon]MBI2130928.1 30S ribosomal protein S4e [Candidatus Woesearchaeota archaeon]
MKRHIKKLAASKSWPILRRDNIFVTRPYPGGHSFELGTSMNVILKDLLKLAPTSREVKKMLLGHDILADNVRRKEPKFLVGLFDTLAIEKTDSYYRISLNKNGKILAVPIKKEEAGIKPCKIAGKSVLKGGKIQLNLSDGKNIIAEKGSYKTGDTLMLSLPDKSVRKHLKLDKNAVIFLTGGKHIGETGTVKNIINDRITYKNESGEMVETLKKYAFVVGEEKPEVTLG